MLEYIVQTQKAKHTCNNGRNAPIWTSGDKIVTPGGVELEEDELSGVDCGTP